MSEEAGLAPDLTDAQWLSRFEALGRSERLGALHSAVLVRTAAATLIVGFDTIDSARAGSAAGVPHALAIARRHGWSCLSLLAHRPTWFRDEAVYRFFDRLTESGAFEEFDRVIFYGAGSNGYAAAAYSVAAPGSDVVLVAPQATLDPAIAGWDDRFRAMRRTDFRSRYGYAPEMVEAAERVILFFDPCEPLDAMHAALFRGVHVSRIRARNAGPRLARDLEQMDVIAETVAALADGTATEAALCQSLRKRRTSLAHLRRLLNRLHGEDRQWLVALLCRWVVARWDVPRFRHHLEIAEKRLARAGKRLPPVRMRRMPPPLDDL